MINNITLTNTWDITCDIEYTEAEKNTWLIWRILTHTPSNYWHPIPHLFFFPFAKLLHFIYVNKTSGGGAAAQCMHNAHVCVSLLFL